MWNYYTRIAELTGRKPDGKQQPFSLYPFYSDTTADEQNELTRAFLDNGRLDFPKADSYLSDSEICRYVSRETPPYDAQIEAIRHAIADPVSLVQGPPGSGKTEMILNLLAVIHGMYPDMTVAVVSSNNEAINNIIEKIADGQSSDAVLNELSGCCAFLGAKSKVKAWKERLQDKGEDETASLIGDGNVIDPAHLERYPIFTSTVHSMKRIFRHTDEFDGQFDYVIVDESSQVNITLGLVAMSCAKHLVLIGDNNQIPPILSEMVEGINEEFTDIPEMYREQDGKSIIHACEQIFAGRIHSTLLNKHYRCHPSIIGFCNEYVYDGQLQVMTKGEGEFRIRAVWYEGDYYEDPKEGVAYNERRNFKTSQRHNMRQIEIFMNEELPSLLRRMDEDDSISVCVISPYKKQLEILHERLADCDIESFFEENEYDGDPTVDDIHRLTIHKAQGKGYDIIYMFTVEDCSYAERWSWCQDRQKVNVAISRAKKEFRIITSSQWLPEEVQKKLTGYVLPILQPEGDDRDQMFFKKLFRYIADNCPEPQGDFGFHRSQMASVFDKIPLYRAISADADSRERKERSAPECCMLSALISKFGDRYEVLSEVPLKCFTGLREYCSENDAAADYLDNGARFDIVLYKDGEAKAILEIDGAFHRALGSSGEAQRERDALKDRLVSEMGAEDIYVRFPVDGTTTEELKKISDILEADAAHIALEISDDADVDISIFNQTLDMCFSDLVLGTREELLTDELCGALADNNYIDPENAEYDHKLRNDLYLCRYATAYSFEYAMIYDIVMRACKKPLDVLSLGCGSLIDAWSMAYSKDKLAYPYGISYTGVDAAKWNRSFVTPAIKRKFASFDFKENDVIDYFEVNRDIGQNVLVFPKIINELSKDEIYALNGKLFKVGFIGDEYYIIASHSHRKCLHGMYRISFIINKIINKNNEFEVCSDIREILGEDQYTAFKNSWCGSNDDLVNLADIGDMQCRFMDDIFRDTGTNTSQKRKQTLEKEFNCYAFSSVTGEKVSYINQLNGDFDNALLREAMPRYIKAMREKELDLRHRIVRASQISFQIIRLRRKK